MFRRVEVRFVCSLIAILRGRNVNGMALANGVRNVEQINCSDFITKIAGFRRQRVS